MSRAARVVQVAMMPLVAGAIYAWLLHHAFIDAKTIIKRRMGAWEPMEHP